MGDSTPNHERFHDIELTDANNDGSAPEERTESQDVMYENTHGVEPPGGDTRRGSHRMEVLRSWSPHLLLVSLLLCILLSTSLVILLLKYLSMSRGLQEPRAAHLTLPGNGTLQSGEESLERTHAEREGPQRGHRGPTTATINPELEEVQMHLEKVLQEMEVLKSTQEQEAAAHRLEMEAMRSKLGQKDREVCPGGWVLFRKTCLWVSEEHRSWEKSKKYCEERDSNLIIVPRNDSALQHFLAERRHGFWVGKQLTWTWPKEWSWPRDYPEVLESICWMTRNGSLQNVPCSENNRWVCEKNLLLTSFKGTAYENLEFSLWGAQFYCYRK